MNHHVFADATSTQAGTIPTLSATSPFYGRPSSEAEKLRQQNRGTAAVTDAGARNLPVKASKQDCDSTESGSEMGPWVSWCWRLEGFRGETVLTCQMLCQRESESSE
jgi:hypothetical protein